MPRLTTAGEMPATIETQDGVTGWKLPGGAFFPLIGGGEGEQAATGEGAQGGASSQANSQAAAGANGAGAQDGDSDFDKDRAMATIKKLREFEKSAKAQLKELDDLKAAQKAAEDSKLGESERSARRLSELEQSLAQAKAEAEQQIADAEAKRLELEADLAHERRAARVARLASTLGAHDPHDANILAATAGIDVSDAKAEEKIETALKELQKIKPYLFKTGRSVEPFNPGTGTGRAETDAQVVARLRGQVQGGPSPFG